jgi:hypothetical protein
MTRRCIQSRHLTCDDSMAHPLDRNSCRTRYWSRRIDICIVATTIIDIRACVIIYRLTKTMKNAVRLADLDSIYMYECVEISIEISLGWGGVQVVPFFLFRVSLLLKTTRVSFVVLSCDPWHCVRSQPYRNVHDSISLSIYIYISIDHANVDRSIHIYIRSSYGVETMMRFHHNENES